MAWTPPSPGELRHRVIIQRRPVADQGGETGDGDGAGNYEGLPVELVRRDCRMTPKTGGEEVQAGRLTGVDVWEIVLRSCSVTRTIGPGDIAVDARDTRQRFNIRSSLDLEGRGRWLVIAAERGVAEG